MKAEDIFGKSVGQVGELTHKLRSVTDLIRHIKTKEESSPANYSIFLGAGASVTSGIRTAGQLTDEWANELYERFKREKSKSPQLAKSYFEKEHPSWYNSDNPYSSLFEKKFDLPTQRRRFVEQEVDGKLPSIGYSYLASLVDYNYFNTIFTTNFDDLLNEAFYVFSNKRPIVCAHDSSIRSVSITSKRPKIVKLHGDYLFDDIKSTLRETESLEQNTKEKFVEFCKEYGLIVVGYSGCDRSIMDVLEFLVKQENYLKNGVYWCLRPGDEVCHNLRNLIWKDKVYPVLIDGFDELFAEIHSQTIGKELNLNSSTKQSKLEMTIRQIVDDTSNLAKNEIIGKEITSIREDGDSKDISGFIKQLSQANESSRLGTKDMRNLLEIDSLVEGLELNTALELCNVHYQGTTSLIEKRVYIEKHIDIYIKLGDDQKVSYWCDRLIEVDPNNIGYSLKKATSIKKLSDRAKFYTDLTARHPYSTTVRNNTANTLIRIIRQFSTDVLQNEKLAKEHLQKSLAIDPSLDNPAWEKSMELSTLLFHRSKDKDIRKSHKDDISELVKTARMRHPEHDQTIELLEAQLGISSTNAEINGILEFFLGLIEKSSRSKKNHIETIICKTFDHIYKASDNGDLKKKIHNFFSEHISEPHQQKPVTLAKIKFLHSLANDRENARREFDSLMTQRKLGAYIGEILDLPIPFTSEDIRLLQSKLELERYELLQGYYFETLSDICMEKHEYEQAAQHIESAHSEGTTLSNYLSKLTYALLKLEDNKRVLTIAVQYSDKLNDIDSEAFIINTQVAAKRIAHSSFNQVALRNLAAQSDSDEVKLCAFSLLDQHPDARRILKKQLEMDPGLEKKYRDWPALNPDYFPDPTIKEICVA